MESPAPARSPAAVAEPAPSASQGISASVQNSQMISATPNPLFQRFDGISTNTYMDISADIARRVGYIREDYWIPGGGGGGSPTYRAAI